MKPFKRRTKTGSERLLRRRAIWSAVGVVIVSVWSFGAIEYFTNVIMGRNPLYNPIDMIGMIGPMGVLMGFVSYASYQATNRYVSKLLNAIEAVAARDFELRLDEAGAGAFHEVFANFNSMAEELKSVQTLRDDFINNFSHEFKTPISAINGFAHLILEKKLDEAEFRQYLEIIASESERLAQMATSALLMTKLDSQSVIIDKESYSLDEQLKHCAILLSPQCSRKGIELSAELEDAALIGSQNLMEQVWINLLGNAIKFTPAKGTITIKLRKQTQKLMVEIADSGKGMSAEEAIHAFDKYYQGDPQASQRGLGLGLAIARKIVELSGGTIRVTSTPGEGSVFTVCLPA